MSRILRRIALFTLVALFLAPAALAQGTQPPVPDADVDVEVSDDELETLAAVFLEIEALQMEYGPKMQEAENQEAAREVQVEFQQKVTETIEAEDDITPQRFSTIMRAAQTDEALRTRISDAVETAREDGN